MSVEADPSGSAPGRPAAAEVCNGVVRVSYLAFGGGRTSPWRTYESGSLRLRHPRGTPCRAILVNTGGGILGGDRFSVDLSLGPQADVTLTTSAAEKIYRSDGAMASMRANLRLGSGSHCTWIPQETILFDRARFRRRFDIELDATAGLLAAEMVVFGRTAHGERDISGLFRDRWRVRRGGRLVYADETRIAGPLSAILDSGAVAAGARAMAAVLIVGPDGSGLLDRVRAAISSCHAAGPRLEGAATLREGIVIARLLADSPERLRAVIAAVLQAVGRGAVPRDWL